MAEKRTVYCKLTTVYESQLEACALLFRVHAHAHYIGSSLQQLILLLGFWQTCFVKIHLSLTPAVDTTVFMDQDIRSPIMKQRVCVRPSSEMSECHLPSTLLCWVKLTICVVSSL